MNVGKKYLKQKSFFTYIRVPITKMGDTMKLLIVDVDRDFVEMLTSWLKMQGFEVYRAYTGDRACMEWEKQRPDIVVIDPKLKDADGLALCRDMCTKHDELVLVISDGKDVHDEVHCLESGYDDLLCYPLCMVL